MSRFLISGRLEVEVSLYPATAVCAALPQDKPHLEAITPLAWCGDTCGHCTFSIMPGVVMTLIDSSTPFTPHAG